MCDLFVWSVRVKKRSVVCEKESESEHICVCVCVSSHTVHLNATRPGYFHTLQRPSCWLRIVLAAAGAADSLRPALANQPSTAAQRGPALPFSSLPAKYCRLLRVTGTPSHLMSSLQIYERRREMGGRTEREREGTRETDLSQSLWGIV